MKTTTNKNRRGLLLAGGLGLLTTAAALALISQSGPAQAEKKAVEAKAPANALTVATTQPERRLLERSQRASGSLEARDELLLGSDVAGIRLVEVLVDVGTTVRKGQLLARGDERQLQAQLAQQRAQVRQAQAELGRARDQLERAESVEDAGVYSQETLQSRRMSAEAAAARLELVQAQQRETELRIEQASIRAPADGQISRRAATVGLVVQPGMELFRLIRDGEIEWRAELPDHAIAAVRAGSLAWVEIAGQTVEGKVRMVAPTVDARTRNGLVHISLPRSAGLKPGSHVQGRIHLGQAEAWVLPESALLSRDGKPFVYLLDGKGRAQAKALQTGGRQQGLVEVSGLAPDAVVIATGAGFVKEGERVNAAPQTTGGGRS